MIMHAEKNEQADQRRNEESAVDARTQRRLLYRARLRSPTSTTRKSLADAPLPSYYDEAGRIATNRPIAGATCGGRAAVIVARSPLSKPLQMSRFCRPRCNARLIGRMANSKAGSARAALVSWIRAYQSKAQLRRPRLISIAVGLRGVRNAQSSVTPPSS